MLSRQHRFHGYNSLRRLYSNSQSARGAFVSLRFAPRTSNRPYRVAVVVGRKVHKSAVKRNRIRRRVYEIIRQSKQTPASTDLVFTVYNDQVADISDTELSSQINELLKKASKSSS
jgi:ribonuclease P protein component